MNIIKKLFIVIAVIILTTINVKASDNLSIETSSYNEKTGVLVVEGNSTYNEVMISVFEDDVVRLFRTTSTTNNNYRFSLKVKFTKDETITIKVGDINSTEYVIDTLDVKKYNSDVTVRTAPVVKASNGNNNTINLSWNSVENAVSYVAYRSENKKTWKALKVVTDTSYVDTGLTYGKTYYYKVKATGIKNYKMSSVVSGKTIPNKVENLHIYSVGTNNIKFSYNKVNVNGYEVYSSTDNKKWSKLTTITKNTTLAYNASKLKANTMYYFKVRAYKTVGKTKVYGPFSVVVNTKTSPEAPKVTLALRDLESMNLVISNTKGATLYVVEKSLDNKTFELLEELPGSGTLTQSELVFGQAYFYRVKACNILNNCSAWTVVGKRLTTKAPGFSLKTSSKKVTVTLTSVEGADGYEVYRATKKNGKYTLVKSLLSESSLTFNNSTKKGTTYYYKVRAYKIVNDKKVYSPFSGIKYIKSK